MSVRLPAHEATTAQLGALYPAVATHTLPVEGLYVGRDLFGGLFVHDPFALYRSGVLSNPNMVVLGEIGRGKSAFVKSFLYRQAAFGRRIVVFDPKGEYGQLTRALGATPITLAPGGALRLNPLDVASANAEASERHRMQLNGLAGMSAASLGRALSPVELVALEVALGDARSRGDVVTLAPVVDALLAPSERGASGVGERPAALRAEAREVAHGLRRFVQGDLAGMFDAVTSPGVDLRAAVVSVDLSALSTSPALGAVVASVQCALEPTFRSARSGPTLLVVDEAWAVLSNLAAARFLQSTFKLARAFGVANVLVVHRASDLAAAGAAGSVTERLAEGLLSDAETVVCYSQSPAEAAGAEALLGLSTAEARTVVGLRRGVALWHVGTQRFLVELRLSAAERALVDTDQALRAEPA